MSRASALIRATDCCLTVLFCATVFLIVVAAPAAAQLAEVNAILKRYTNYLMRGIIPAALVEAQKLEAAVIRGFGTNHRNYPAALNNMGRVYQMQGRYKEAEDLYKRALASLETRRARYRASTLRTRSIVWEECPPSSGNTTTRRSSSTARWRSRRRRSAQATARWRLPSPASPISVTSRASTRKVWRSISVRWRSGKGRSAPAIPMWRRRSTTLAMGAVNQGKYAEAEALFKRALAIEQKALGDQAIAKLATTLHSLATGVPPSRQVRRGRAALQTIPGDQGDCPRPRITTWWRPLLENLAVLYDDQGKHDDAERLYKRALAIQERTLGEYHPHTAHTVINLGTLYAEQGKYAEAQELYKRALTSNT